MFLIPILFTIIGAILRILFRNGKKAQIIIANIVLLLGLTGLFMIIWLLYSLSIGFNGILPISIRDIFSCAFAALLALILIATALYLFKKLKTKSYAIILAALLALSAVCLFCEPMYEHYKEKNTVSTSIDKQKYEPFSDTSEIARLDTPASISFVENEPVIDGAIALYPLYSAFATAVYHSENHEAHVRCTNTTPSYEAIVNGDIDIAFCAAPSYEQEQYARDLGKELQLTPIGREAFVFYVNAKNPIDNLTSEDIRKIYSGDITNWSQLGGNDEPILTYQRNKGSGSQSAFIRFMGDTKIKEPITEEVVGGMEGIVDKVSDYKNSKGAIGFSFRYFVTGMMKSDVKLLSIDGVEPNTENIKNGSYPLTSEFYAVTTDSKNENVGTFIDWILSDEGQTLVERTGYVGIK